MIPWVELDRVALPAGDLRLMRRGAEFVIKLGVNELMTSRLSGSEKALATLACEKISARARPRILVGGLGMGFTLRAALGALGPDARVVVAELVPAVIAWARGPMAAIFEGCLDDPRLELIQTDVAEVIRAKPADFDAILLDVDNGPEGMTQAANDKLYSARGLAAARLALRPGGVLAVWSVGPDRAFAERLERAGYRVEEKRARASGRGGARHVIWLAQRA